MKSTLDRLDSFVDIIDFSKGVANPAIIAALTNVSNVIKGSRDMKSFAEGFADHVISNDTVQTSALFKDLDIKDRKSIISTVIDLLVSFAFFYIGKKKFAKESKTPEVLPQGRGNGSVSDWNRNSENDRGATPSPDDSSKPSIADGIIESMSKIVGDHNYDAFDDAMTHLQYQVLNSFKL